MTQTKLKRNRVVYGEEYNFGTILKQLRIDRGYTQDVVAKAIKVQPPTLSAYEHDKQKPSIMLLIDLANVYNVDMNELIGHEVAKTNNVKFINVFNQLSNKNRKAVTENASYLLVKQEVNAELINYNTRSKTR